MPLYTSGQITTLQSKASQWTTDRAAMQPVQNAVQVSDRDHRAYKVVSQIMEHLAQAIMLAGILDDVNDDDFTNT